MLCMSDMPIYILRIIYVWKHSETAQQKKELHDEMRRHTKKGTCYIFLIYTYIYYR